MINRFLQSFKNKKVRYGAFSTVMTLMIIAILLVVNLVASQLNLSYDLTPTKKYSLSTESIDIVKGLEQDVTIYAFFKTGMENPLFNDLLKQYPANSNKISLEYKDPALYPSFAQQFAEQGEQVPFDSVVVKSDDKFRLILADDMIEMGYDQQTYQQYIKGVNAESDITNAIVYVTSKEAPAIYHITGHNEEALPPDFQRQLKNAGYEVKDLDIAREEMVPEDAKIVLITMPKRDWSPNEAEKVTQYLQKDGNAIVITDPTPMALPNMESVLNAYGIQSDNDLIVETNQDNAASIGGQVFLSPNFTTHDIDKKLVESNYFVLMYQPGSFSTMDVKKKSLTIEPVLTTSPEAYGKTGTATTLTKEAGDLTGPLNIAVAITDANYTDAQHTTKIVAVGSSSIINGQLDAVTSGGNSTFIMNVLSWIRGEDATQYIPPKSDAPQPLQMTLNNAVTLIVISVIIIPVAILITGGVVFVRRRNS